MINRALRCPNCDRFGFVDATNEANLDRLVGAICHYCGHFLDHQGILECLAKTAAEQKASPQGR